MTQRSAERMRSFFRTGFAACVQYCLKHGIEYIIVESGDRFARNLVVQETGLEWLEELGLEVICAENETQFSEPSAVQRKNHVLRVCVLSLPERSRLDRSLRIAS